MAGEAALARRAALEAELAALQAELAEYQQIADDIPAIYEEKFRQQLQQLALELRRLMEEREALQQQIAALLPSQAARPALSPRDTPSMRSTHLVSPSWRWLPFPWVRIGQLRSFVASEQSDPKRAASALVVMGGLLLLGGTLWTSRSLAPRSSAQRSSVAASVPSQPSVQRPASDPVLRLRALGECWLEVRRLDDAPVLNTTLQPGEQRRLPLGSGLKVRAGRPDLLRVAVADSPEAVLNRIEEIGWKIYRGTN